MNFLCGEKNIKKGLQYDVTRDILFLVAAMTGATKRTHLENKIWNKANDEMVIRQVASPGEKP
jgi:hypothetical protein